MHFKTFEELLIKVGSINPNYDIRAFEEFDLNQNKFALAFTSLKSKSLYLFGSI